MTNIRNLGTIEDEQLFPYAPDIGAGAIWKVCWRRQQSES